MTVPIRKPRGRPFLRGNPGRPLGSKNRVTQTLEQLAEGQAERLSKRYGSWPRPATSPVCG
jgi:hypothetical protein